MEGTDGDEGLLRLHSLVRDAVRARQVDGAQQRRRRELIAAWTANVAGDPLVAPYLLARERVAALSAVAPSGAMEYTLALMQRQIAEFRIGRARTLGEMLIEADLRGQERARLLMMMGRAERAAANYGRARELFSRAGAELSPEAPPELRLPQMQQLAECERLDGNTDAARLTYVELARQAHAVTPGDAVATRVARMRAAWGLALVEAQADDIEAARLHLTELERHQSLLTDPSATAAAKRFDLTGFPTAAGHLDRFRARLLRIEGDLAAAEAAAESALAHYGERSRISRLLAQLTRAKLRLESGEVADALRVATETAHGFRELGDMRSYASTLVVMADCAIELEIWAEADGWLEEMTHYQSRYPFAPVYAALARGEIARRSGDPDAALALYDGIRPAAARLGIRIETAVAHLGMAEALRMLGRPGLAFEQAWLGRRIAQRCGYAAPRVWAEVVCARVGAPWMDEAHCDSARVVLAAMTARDGGPSPEGRLLALPPDQPLPMRAP
jgi:hypothetical protein